MTAGTGNLGGSRTRSMDDEAMEKFNEHRKYGSGWGIRCEINIQAQKIYESTSDMEPHERLGRITSFALESLANKEGMTDKTKSKILAAVIEDYRTELKLDQ